MDGCDLESCAGVHENQSRMYALLRRDVSRNVFAACPDTPTNRDLTFGSFLKSSLSLSDGGPPGWFS